MTTRKLSKVKTKKTKNIGHIMKSEVFFSSIAKIKNKEPSLRSSITSNTGSINNKNTNNNIFGAPFGLSEAKFEEIAP